MDNFKILKRESRVAIIGKILSTITGLNIHFHHYNIAAQPGELSTFWITATCRCGDTQIPRSMPDQLWSNKPRNTANYEIL